MKGTEDEMNEGEIQKAVENGELGTWSAKRLKAAFAFCEGKFSSAADSQDQTTYRNFMEKVQDAQIVESLHRSGYLLEGRVIAELNRMGLYVQSGPSHFDKKAEKSREIDVVAESGDYEPELSRERILVKTTFVIEAINNPTPVLFLTPEKWSPLAYHEDGLIPHVVTPGSMNGEHPFEPEVTLQFEKPIEGDIYCQFCSFTQKNNSGDLMASHSDDLYGAIKKAAEFALSGRDDWKSIPEEPPCWRIFQWRPILVLGGVLCLWNDSKMVRVPHARYRFNFHWEGSPESVAIDVVTDAELPRFVESGLAEDRAIELKLLNLKKRKEAEVEEVLRKHGIDLSSLKTTEIRDSPSSTPS